jgi:Fur family transcriptional regulator, peroxide stress response regulator
MEWFYSECKKHNLKITPQREAIYKVLVTDKTHPTADSIWKKVKKTCPNISLDTVNRTLISFSELGIIDTIICSGQGKKYDPNAKAHHHLKCIKCGEITDFYNSTYDSLSIPKDVIKEFTVLKKKVVLTGVCSKCKKRIKKQQN